MSERHDIDPVLQQWAYQPGVISARIVRAGDGREVLQMRIELGVLQMELEGRPDGQKPDDHPTYLAALQARAAAAPAPYNLSEDECFEVDREFLQYYHRRICCLALREFRRAMVDADHTLRLMDFVVAHSPDADWTLSHEQYRPFVLFHRAQAAAMVALEDSTPEAAIEQINLGLDAIRHVFASHEAAEQFDRDELVGHLRELKESLRREYELGPTLAEQLADAVAAEQYERAARLRDEIVRRRSSQA
jgi:hypothetical protein